MEDPFYVKYLKYKMKYLALKEEMEGGVTFKRNNVDYLLNITSRTRTGIKKGKDIEEYVEYQKVNNPDRNREFPFNDFIQTYFLNNYNDEIWGIIYGFLDSNKDRYLIFDYYETSRKDGTSSKDGQYGAITGTGNPGESDEELIFREICEETGYKESGILENNKLGLERKDLKHYGTYGDNIKVYTATISTDINILSICHTKRMSQRKCVSFIALTDNKITEIYGNTGSMYIVDKIAGLGFIKIAGQLLGYYSVEYQKGYRDGIGLIEPPQSANRNYMNGYNKGINNKGYQDGKDDKSEGVKIYKSENPNYKIGYNNGFK